MIQETSDIVITGLAAISAAGVGVELLVAAVRNSESCLTPVPEEIAVRPGLRWGKAAQFRTADFMPPLKARKFDRCSLLATVATGLALSHAGVTKGSLSPERIGITMGSGFGGIANSEEFLTGYFQTGVDGLAPMLFPNTVANAAASNASIEHGLQGPNVTTVQRFCSAESAFQLACRFIAEGRADVMVTGGVDELTPRMLQGFHALHQDRHYAADYAEGCGLLVLERRAHAEARRAEILGTVTAVRTLGLLLAGRESEAVGKLLPPGQPELLSLSGTADLMPLFADLLPRTPRVALPPVTGRSIAMGGLAMAALVATLADGETGLHLAASPEGPYFAISFTGGAPV
ncbi:3-oxoacyl-[acyl-carrier-protein] synthase 2 [Geobacter sp. OR-1]|uniref:beta-ketoacyl synthase N-terminal-like domain-containing protein n=1 Tax=Geobacter sp. OR-1 TaxID=1266765 RepID=UPI000542A3CC|nr:beta-ketoacyl synthase N-terminal-like domain-containing protein [Geobacter sp. OR-1]GAM08859.1 3-oxoacyl-[acyl-carrier-protein] synthase 2 [Geobacter sp. OR-1]